jgi:hypothetical protein
MARAKETSNRTSREAHSAAVLLAATRRTVAGVDVVLLAAKVIAVHLVDMLTEGLRIRVKWLARRRARPSKLVQQ